MSRQIKLAHTITQDDDSFMVVLSKKRDIKCKLCNVIFPKTYNLKRHMNNFQFLDKRMRISNYGAKNLESKPHGKKKFPEKEDAQKIIIGRAKLDFAKMQRAGRD